MSDCHRILSELQRVLKLKSSEVTKTGKDKGGYNFGVDASYVEDMLEELNMSALKSTPAVRWERRETDEEDRPANAQKVYLQLFGKLLLIDRTYVVRWENLRRVLVQQATRLEEHPVNPAILAWKPGSMSFNLEAVKRALEGSVLTNGDADWAGDADRFSVSGSASWVKDRLGWYARQAVELFANVTDPELMVATEAALAVDSLIVAGKTEFDLDGRLPDDRQRRKEEG